MDFMASFLKTLPIATPKTYGSLELIVESDKGKKWSLNIKQNPWTLRERSFKMQSKQILHLGKKKKSGFSWRNLAPEVFILTIFKKI